ncbi:transposase domain-containing protein [Paraburkholderia sp. SIMBA_009]
MRISASNCSLLRRLRSGVPPRFHARYLRTVFERIAGHPINRIDELLPWRLMPAAHIEQQTA